MDKKVTNSTQGNFWFNERCNSCTNSKQGCFWFKTDDHYLDLEKGGQYNQFDDFSEQLQKSDLTAIEVNHKTILIENKSKQSVTVIRHECGPEIVGFLFDLGKAAMVALIIKALEKTIKKTGKKRNDKPQYKVIFINRQTQVTVTSYTKENILKTMQENT